MRTFTLKARLLLATLVMAALTGCATAPQSAPKFTPAPPAPEGYATVYIYRISEAPYTADITVSIAGKLVVSAPNQGYTWLHVKTGIHLVYAAWPKLPGPVVWPDAAFTELFEPGQVYYLKLSGRLVPQPGANQLGLIPATRIYNMLPEYGTAELHACCRFIKQNTESVE